jgi:hypothetical protein
LEESTVTAWPVLKEDDDEKSRSSTTVTPPNRLAVRAMTGAET